MKEKLIEKGVSEFTKPIKGPAGVLLKVLKYEIARKLTKTPGALLSKLSIATREAIARALDYRPHN